ncbi:PLP-dependent aminotransferase family protein [Roseibium denhamense]|uniref:Transcriptional regulator, GntR family n=1 Tax=Roseibium denhamense TaxID=76305 RepID=A0ABY1PHE5_9HYPH|nr:PLP-dependent aminotransferase family protein [Roseibium denhamense]MTI04783.1 PLP-dependent aminotransferase family protein [Roseibium denhamense]SMP33527.1 transcriptional regulator, GntR family [Roseibium denhamense]
MTDWYPDLSGSNAPRYLALAQCIEDDIASGRLKPGDRLPAQRPLAQKLGLDFTTVARGYTEARRRGIIASQVGSGTFVTKTGGQGRLRSPSQGEQRNPLPDHSMNLPPETADPDLIAQMQDSLERLKTDLVPLMRYQSFDTSVIDLEAGAHWLGGSGLFPERKHILIAPGAQAALAAILAQLAQRGDTIACEAITYPGIRSLCAQMGLRLQGIATDVDGVVPEAFEDTCRKDQPKALYLNPTLQNPTCCTIPQERRVQLAKIADRFQVPIIEDDPYSQLDPKAPPPLATTAPELTWHISSLSKCVSAGLRIAYIVPPDKQAGWQLSRAMRTSHVMPAPFTVALATDWIQKGIATRLRDFVRTESMARQASAAKALQGQRYSANPNGFHLWLELVHGWTGAALANQSPLRLLGPASAEAFCVDAAAPAAVRLCLGGPTSRGEIANALDALAGLLGASPEEASAFM